MTFCGKMLAKKMTVLYKLGREQLSKQFHYDFGLRALKSVLVMAGELKRGAPDLSEDVLLMRALRDMNLPKVMVIRFVINSFVLSWMIFVELMYEHCS